MSSYNLESVDEMAGGDQEFMREVVQTFLNEVPPDVHAMNEAIFNENPDLAYQFVHKIKPNLQLFGLQVMEEVELIETWAKNGKRKNEVLEAAATITKKVQVAGFALKKDFELA